MSSLRELLIKQYQYTVINSPTIPRELKEALRVHERVPAFLDNLCRELSNPIFKNYSNNQIRDVANDTIQFFIACVKQRADEQMLSDIAKMQIKQDIQDKQVLNKAADTGVINEEVLHVLSRQKEKDADQNEE